MWVAHFGELGPPSRTIGGQGLRHRTVRRPPSRAARCRCAGATPVANMVCRPRSWNLNTRASATGSGGMLMPMNTRGPIERGLGDLIATGATFVPRPGSDNDTKSPPHRIAASRIAIACSPRSRSDHLRIHQHRGYFRPRRLPLRSWLFHRRDRSWPITRHRDPSRYKPDLYAHRACGPWAVCRRSPLRAHCHCFGEVVDSTGFEDGAATP